MRKIIYISGPISGIPYKESKARFDRASRILAATYPKARIINPMRKFFPKGMKWQWHMLIDLFLLSFSTHVYQLDGWKESDGALIEHCWANHLGIKVLTLENSKRLIEHCLNEDANFRDVVRKNEKIEAY